MANSSTHRSLAASQKVMRSYLSELLTDESEKLTHNPVEQKQVSIRKSHPEVTREAFTETEKLEKLLKTVSEPLKELAIEKPIISRKQQAAPIEKRKITFAPPVEKTEEVTKVEEVTEELPISTQKSKGELKLNQERNYRKGAFQAMFFDVAGLTVAVPLIELGGIHNIDKITSLTGKPKWYKGIMLHREEQINVVDTALWVMPEKCDEKLKNSLNYQYIIMLSNSNWGLSAENLVDTVTLQQDDVKWLDSPSKRPWLAGLVKDRMCALLDVESMISLLNKGLTIHQK